MAVIIKYIVVRNGEEKMTFASKKEADEYDKMLDIADNILEFMENSKLSLEESQLQDMSLYMAQNRDNLISILKGGAMTNNMTNKKLSVSSGTKVQGASDSKAQNAKKSKAKESIEQEKSE
jgi:uncharacterized protein